MSEKKEKKDKKDKTTSSSSSSCDDSVDLSEVVLRIPTPKSKSKRRASVIPYIVEERTIELQDVMDIVTTNAKMLEDGFILPGEEIKNIFESVKVKLVGCTKSKTCIIFLTNFQLLFLSVPKLKRHRAIHGVPMSTISRLKPFYQESAKSKEKKPAIMVYCKDGRLLIITFPRKEERSAAKSFIARYAFPPSSQQLFAFVHRAISNDQEVGKFIDVEKDYIRLSMSDDPNLRICRLNANFELCTTYPQILVVPSTLTDQEVQQVAQFRSRGRMPSIVWRHPVKKSLLARSSQPCVGLKGNRCAADEKYVSAMKTESQSRMWIFDSRPQLNAVANMLRGGGYESENVYKDCELEFNNIENIHDMRHSLESLVKVCREATETKTLDEWERDVAASKWLVHIRAVMVASVRTAELLEKGESILVHCSDGWDRTAQTVALAEMMLDPYYRTIDGFILIVEKEWVQFGHQFALRCGHGKAMENYKEGQRAPIFLQWLDCVWQILTMYPTRFEFNETLLIAISEELFACRFGTFLFDCHRERVENSVPERTASFWSFVKLHKDLFTNNEYTRTDEPIIPTEQMATNVLRLWTNYHLKYKPEEIRDQRVHEKNTLDSGSSSSSSNGETRSKRSNTASSSSSSAPSNHFATISSSTSKRSRPELPTGSGDSSSPSSSSAPPSEAVPSGSESPSVAHRDAGLSSSAEALSLDSPAKTRKKKGSRSKTHKKTKLADSDSGSGSDS